jgi:hypothetical protein
MTETSLTMFINYKDIPDVIFYRWIDKRGLAFKIPRNRVGEVLSKVPEGGYDTFRDKACIYILFGENKDGDEKAYIGESTSIDIRLRTHAFSSKSWNWETAVIFCRNDTEFNKGHILYMEEHLILKARDGRFDIPNDGQNRRRGVTQTINTAHQKAADDFVENIQLLSSALGYRLFEPMPLVVEETQVSTTPTGGVQQPPRIDVQTFTTKASDKYKATGKLAGEGKTFIVLAGSTMNPTEVNSIPESAKEKRSELIESGIVKDWRFEKDCVFRSPAAAAGVIHGGSVNAYIIWEGLDIFLQQREDEFLRQQESIVE